MKLNGQEHETYSAAEQGGIDRVKKFIVPDMGGYVLLPGDPKRVSVMASQWDKGSTKEYDLIRGYRAATGLYKGTRISCVSTGIGGPSFENPFASLVSGGIDTFIRVGTTGAIQEDINIGDIIINDCNVRLDGTSSLYIRNEYPSAASVEVTMALMQACENLGFRYHVGVGCTTASFHAGQSRVSCNGYKTVDSDRDFKEFKQAKVLNYEMEGATLMTLSRLFGVRAGMCAVVIAQRISGEWNTEGMETRACLVGAEAVNILTRWDEAKKNANKKYFTPGLIDTEKTI